MPSSWDVYYVVFLSALLALGVPALLALISYLVSSEVRSKETPGVDQPVPVPHARTALGRRINARFFLGVNASLVLIALGLALIPCVGMLQQEIGQPAYLRGLIATISLAAFSGLGLLYSASKGDLSWVKSFQTLAKMDREAGEPQAPALAPEHEQERPS